MYLMVICKYMHLEIALPEGHITILRIYYTPATIKKIKTYIQHLIYIFVFAYANFL